MPPLQARYAHTNLIARDWRRMVRFYCDVFGCEPVGSERAHRGAWIEEVTAVPGAAIDGVHLRLPGLGENAPTLEIFSYHRMPESLPPAANRPGFAHIAFEVDDVAAARQAVLAHGGGDLGRIHTRPVPGAGTITLVYLTDPEGNIVELQHWEK